MPLMSILGRSYAASRILMRLDRGYPLLFIGEEGIGAGQG